MHNPSANICYWLATSYLQGVGPVRLRRLLGHFGDIKNLFSASSVELKEVGASPEQIDSFKKINWRQVEADLQWAEKENCHLIPWDSEEYPALLKEIPDAPSLLYVKGNKELLAQPQIAMVGTRNPSMTGQQNAEEFAVALTQAGLLVTSGLAIGIDGVSHRGALKVGGKTIAVLGSGLARIYPQSHVTLAHDIIANGAIVSEFAPNMPPKAQYFPMRNRIISGLSLGVLIIEAALRSGSLITARYAVDQGREVFALPGSLHNPLARGCHYLIRQGAKLVETAQDILEELGTINAFVVNKINKPPEETKAHETYEFLLNMIGYDPTSLDTIIVRSGLTPGEVSSMLLMLELKGCIGVGSGGYIRKV